MSIVPRSDILWITGKRRFMHEKFARNVLNSIIEPKKTYDFKHFRFKKMELKVFFKNIKTNLLDFLERHFCR